MREQNNIPFVGKPVKTAYMWRDIEPASLGEGGQDPKHCVERAGGDDIAGIYDQATQEARRLGLFGSPTFVVRGELFWGDDRLDDALSWLRHGRLSP